MEQYIRNKKGLKMHIEEHLFDDEAVFLLCHGFTGSIQSYVISQTRFFLKERGISSVSIDFTNNINRSEGDFSEHTVSAEVEDLAVIYERVAKRYKKIHLIGHSMGCTVALQFCLKQPVDGLLLIAPPYSMQDIIHIIARTNYGDEQEVLQNWKRDGTYRFYKEKTQSYYSLAYPYYEDLCMIDTQRFQTIQIPTAIIYSLADPLVPPRDSERLFAELASERKVIHPIANAPHSFNDKISSQLLMEKVEQSIQFLKE